MPIKPGTRFGSYEVVEPIGSGGMGEVWRATDPALKRDIALKVLPQDRHLDTEASLRFEREARMLAALNHPNIATLHGLETSDGVQALVMELVEGESLDTRILRSPRGLPVSEAIEIAVQIATALDAAHEQGIVHRDLKPANIRIRPDGTVKVLDFGIAKAFGTGGVGGDAGTVTQTPGAIVGTPCYMSPEQASGADVDRRTDIWAFGCVLYEMLTGQRVFDGDTSSRILARVLERDPDWDLLPRDLPPRIRTLLGQCLEKNVRRRRRDAGDLRLEIELAGSEPDIGPAATRGRAGPRMAWVAGTTAAAVLAIGAAIYLYSTPAPREQSVLDVVTPATRELHGFAVSPDGRSIAYVAAESEDSILQVLYLRDLVTGEERPVPGTEGASNPCWSPDSRSIAYFAAEYLHRIDVRGGAPVALAPALNNAGCSWGESGEILFTPSAVTPIYSVPVQGGRHREVTAIDLSNGAMRETNHRYPSFIPGTDLFLYFVTGGEAAQGLHLGSLDGTVSRRLAATDSAGAFAAPDWIVYRQNDRLVARRFDPARQELTGDPVTVAILQDVYAGSQIAFSASADGQRIAYRDAAPPSGGGFTWYDRSGEVLSTEQIGINGPELSADGSLLAYDNGSGNNRDIYYLDIETGEPRRMAFDGTVEGYPEFSPGGGELLYEKQRADQFFELWVVDIDRPESARLVWSEAENRLNLIPLDWSSSGYALVRRSDPDFLSSDLVAISLTDEDARPIEIAASASDEERLGEFSPDGNWVVYDSTSPGQFGVFVQSFPEADGIQQVSANGFAPRWSRDGTEIVFLTLDGRVMAAPVRELDSGLEFLSPVELFRANIGGPSFNHQYVVTSDGRFGIGVFEIDEFPAPIRLIQNPAML